MVLTLALFILGFVFLVKGADLLVDGSSSIAKKYGLSSIMIGLTIVAFGTSLPELIVSVIAATGGNSDIAISNIIGSNFSNTLLILGITALVTPLVIKKSTVNKEIPLSLLAIFAVGILVNDLILNGVSPNGLARIDGLILLLFFVIFIYYTFGISREKKNKLPSLKLTEDREIKKHNNWLSVGMIAVGLVGLYFGGRWIVDGATEIARLFGLSEVLIGLTIVAVGTSLPELAASIMAARKGQTDMAMGNVIGSNIFNLLWILGLSASIFPISYNPALNVDIIILIAITMLLFPLIYIGRKNVLTKREGAILLALYIAYLVFVAIRG